MKFFSFNVDSLPNQLSELPFCMITEELDLAAITEVAQKKYLVNLIS